MPTEVSEAFEGQADPGSAAATLVRASMARYLARAAMSGAAVGATAILLVTASAPLVASASAATRLVQGTVLGLALGIVVLAGADLFTSTAATSITGFLRRTTDAADVALLWLAGLIGNLAGALGLAFVVDAAGLLTSGGPAGQPSSAHKALGAIALGIGDLSGGQLFLRAVLCNVLLCTGIRVAGRASTDGARLLVLATAVLTFVAAGLELSVLNMTTLSLAALSDVGTWSDLTRNLLFTVPGNLVGAALFVAAVHGIRRDPAAPTAQAAPAVPAAPALPEPEPEPEPEPPKAVAKKAVAKKAVAKKAVAKKAVAKKATTTKAAAKKAAPRRRAR